MVTFSSLKEMVSFYSPSILGMWEASAAGHGWAKHIHHLQCELGYEKQALRTCRYNEFFCATSATFAVQARDCCLLKRDLKAFLNLK